MDPKGAAPTIVATEADHIGVIDQGKSENYLNVSV